MFSITVLEIATKRTFTKRFNSEYLARQFVNRYKHSKKLRVIETCGFY